MEWFTIALGYWSFFFAAAILFGVNQAVKKIFPRPEEQKSHAIVWALLPLYPIVLGALFGLLTGSPVPVHMREFGSLAGSLYFATAGLVAIYFRDIYKTAAKFWPTLGKLEPSIIPPAPEVTQDKEP